MRLPYELNLRIGLLGEFSLEVSRFESRVQIKTEDRCANVKSLLSLMSLEIPAGAPFTLCVEGEDEREAMAVLGGILEKPLQPPPGANKPL